MASISNQREPQHHNTTSTTVWTRRLIILLTILAAIALAFVIIWGASHIGTTILILVLAALIAYTIAPVIERFHHVMPRPVAILLAYLIVLILLGILLYLIISTMVTQLTLLANNVRRLLIPASNGQASPLENILMRIGLTKSQIQSLAGQPRGEAGAVQGRPEAVARPGEVVSGGGGVQPRVDAGEQDAQAGSDDVGDGQAGCRR
jgi:predicted PurR-regulated permease PerM